MRSYRIIAFLLLTVFFISCEDYLTDISLDPNAPIAPDISIILPSVQVRIADAYGGHHSRINGAHIQHIEPVFRTISYTTLFGDPIRFDDPWEEYYSDILVEINAVQAVAERNGFHHVAGVTMTLKAFAAMMATDVWGDIPFREAGLGFENLNPTFDTQEQIYQDIHQLLDEAIDLFNGPRGGLDPSGFDLIYSGDPAKWIKAANGLKARAYLHFNEYANALSFARNSFIDRSENMRVTYPGVDYAGPWYNQNITRTGDYEFSFSMRSRMLDFNDTSRLAVLNLPFTASHPYLVADFGLDFISYREVQFIIAEAGLEQNVQGAEIRNAYLNGIEASFQELGFESNSVDFQIYISQALVDPGVNSISMDHILTQKHFGLFLQPEAFSDWRRRGVPSLNPISGPSIPVRWPYSQSTIDLNSNAPPEVDIFNDRVSWDID